MRKTATKLSNGNSKKMNGRASGQQSKLLYSRRAELVKKGLACWYHPYRTVEECIIASGIDTL